MECVFCWIELVSVLLHITSSRRPVVVRERQKTLGKDTRHIVLISIQNSQNSRSLCMPTSPSIVVAVCCGWYYCHHAIALPPTDIESFYWVNFYTNCGCTFRRRDILQMILLFQESRIVYLLSAHNGTSCSDSLVFSIVVVGEGSRISLHFDTWGTR